MSVSFFNANLFREALGEGSAQAVSDLVLFEEIDSTSSWLMKQPGNGAPVGTVVIAQRQTGGRGRSGNSWHSTHNENLYISYALRIEGEIENRLPLVPLAAGIAAYEALSALQVTDVRLKWPNDLMLHDRKVGGILCETPGISGDAAVAVVGMGVNIGAQPFPEELMRIAHYICPASDMPAFRERLAARWIVSLFRWCERIQSSEVVALIDRWKQAGEPFGRLVRVGDVVGHTMDLNDEGRLLVRQSDGEIRVIPGGMVTHLD